MSSKWPHAFNVLLGERDWKSLCVLAQRRGWSKGMVLRELVRGAAAMEVSGVACCADGAYCLVPSVYAAQHERASREAKE